MKKIVFLGRGGAGKSTSARRLSETINVPLVELDKVFWQPGLQPLGKEAWITLQRELARKDEWIMDGDLGKYDVLSERLKYADTVIILNFPLFTCAWRAFRRSSERLDFWWWLVTWRRVELPKILKSVEQHAPDAKLIILKNQRQLDQFLSETEIR